MKSEFLKTVSKHMWTRRYAKKTIETYLYWIKAFIIYNGKRHSNELHSVETESFLSFLANERNVAPKTQAIALNALVFLYKDVLNKPLNLAINFNRSTNQAKLPTVLTRKETVTFFHVINPKYSLACQLMYGSGLRLMELIRLRIQDIDFDYFSVQVWNGKGGKQFSWQFLFPSNRLSTDPENGTIRRHHIDPTCVQKAVRTAALKAKLDKRVTCHTLETLLLLIYLKGGPTFEPYKSN